LVGEDSVGSPQDEVPDGRLRIELLRTLQRVAEMDRSGWHAQAQRRGPLAAALRSLRRGQARARPGVARSVILRAVRRAGGCDLRAGAEALVDVVAELCDGGLVESVTTRLPVRPARA